ncbi:helix-turn-helix domain-containing protein [Lachnospiraceae bacterium]|nr:helix-turn-helix domain-containing protein [Lachnospiraceae bacterium]
MSYFGYQRARRTDAVLRHYTAYIKYLSMYKGYINDDTQDRLKTKLVEAILKFRFDR